MSDAATSMSIPDDMVVSSAPNHANEPESVEDGRFII